MSSSSRTRGAGYGAIGGSRVSDDDSSSGSSSSVRNSAAEGRRHNQRPWLRACIASVAVVAAVGLLRASRPTSHASTRGNHLIDPSAGSFAAESTQTAAAYRDDAPQAQANSPATGVVAGKGAAPDGEQEELLFVASNEYTRRGDVVGLGYPWLQDRILVEPFRLTTLEVVSPREGMSYSWTVTAMSPEVTVIDKMPIKYSGASVDMIFERSPMYSVVLEEKTAGAAAGAGAGEGSGGGENGSREEGIVRSVNVEIFCKYVRREIRSLFDQERDDMFDAMKVMWDVEIEEGKALYGPDYLDVWTIDMFHQVGASDILCDHLHDGIGFGITHSMVTMMFENSLQLINPMLSLPYWDFTIEGAVVDLEFDGDYTRLAEASPLWGPDWFGGVDTTDYQVKDGRWGSLPVQVIEPDARLDLGADVYGRMRSPWNVNSRPYLSRGLGEMCGIDSTEFYSWPGCSSHYDLQDIFTSYYGYTWWSQYGPHGPIHVWVGGNFDCEENLDTVLDIVGEDYRESMSGYLFVKRKDMFRDAMFKCRGYAEPTVSQKDIMTSGVCGCLDLDLSPDGDDYIEVFENFSSFYMFDQEFTEEEKRILAAQWCNGQVAMGESSQSSSPLDPTFWSMHPTMERLLVFKLLAGTFTDWSWPDEVGPWVGMDGIEYDVEISTRSDTCYGHRGSDIFPYEILDDTINPEFTFYGTKGVNTLQNRQLIKLFDPNENALPFIYDNFEWSHCEALGFDFSDFFDTSTMQSGPKGSAASKEEKEKPGRIHGFEMFERNVNNRTPGFDPPAKIKKMLQERKEKQQQFKQQKKQ